MIGQSILLTVLVLVSLFAVLFLGGIGSAAWEAHRERKAGLPVSRPAWDAKAHRAATGGRWAYLRGVVKGIRS